MAQVRALVRKLVLEELLSGEVLEVWIIDPAFAHAFVGQSVNCLSKKSPITNCVAIPGRPPSLYSGAISPSMNSQSILPASCTRACSVPIESRRFSEGQGRDSLCALIRFWEAGRCRRPILKTCRRE